MKQNRLISIGAFILVLALSGLMTGCMEKDVYDPNREKEPLPDPDKYFGFEMRSDVRLSVNYDIYGFTPLIEIYGENPMETVEGTPIKKEGIEALFKTYTDNSGKYEGKMQLPTYLNKVYLYTATWGLPGCIELEIKDNAVIFDMSAKSNPDDIDLVIVATTTADYHFPSTASILCERVKLKNAFAFDMQAVCSGFLYALETGANFIRSGKYKKVIVVGADKMSSVIDYTDRATCPIFGDGAAAFMLEPTREDMGVMDAVLRTDGKGLPFLHIKAGGSVCAPSYYTLDNRMHYIYQEGRTVFKYAVANMADACEAVMERNHLTKEDIDWVIPHQANMRIITAVSQRLGVSPEKVMVNIERYGNTSAGTLPLCVWDFEDKLKKGDKLIFTAFGAGFAWGAIYVKWGYDGKG